MVQRITNGTFTSGLSGWSPSSECPSDTWDCTVEGDPYPTGPPCCILTSFEGGCTSRIDQSVDLTGVPKITFTAKMYPGFWWDFPGWVRVYLDNQIVYDAPIDVDDFSDFEILLEGWTGTHILSFRVRGDEVGSQIRVKAISAIVPNDIANFWAEPLIGSTPLVVRFHDISVDPLGNVATNWFWDFGDPGQTRYVYGQRNPIHIFEKPGTYTIILTAYWSWGSAIKIRTNYIVTTPGYDPLFTLNICTRE